jgi:group I intron endonuclease
MQKGIIYKIINKINNKVYIGCTTKTIEKRYKSHLYRCFKKNYDSRLYNSMRKYGIENFEIELLEECDIDSIYEIEKIYIQKFDSYKNGLNSTLGGEGFLGYTHSKETRQIITKNLISNGNSHKNKTYKEIYGEDFTKEIEKRKIGAKNSWSNMSVEKKQDRVSKISKSLIGVLAGDKNPMKKQENAIKVTGANNGRAKAIIQYTKCGELINEFSTIIEATLHTGINNIGAVCKGLNKSAGGYIWKYKN